MAHCKYENKELWMFKANCVYY